MLVDFRRTSGRIAPDLPVALPRPGVDPEELRRSPEYAEVGRAVKAAAA